MQIERFQVSKMKKNHLFFQIVLKDFRSHFKELLILIVCETLLIAVSYAGAIGYQMFSNAHSSELFMREDGISRVFVSAGMIFLFCGVVLIITVLISYLGKRVPEYVLLQRLGISNADFRKMLILEAGFSYLIAIVTGFIFGTFISFGLKYLLIHVLDIQFSLGRVSFFTYPLICLFALFIYALGFLLVKELQADFLVITNTQETTRKEKLTGRLTAVKVVIGTGLCIYSAFAYSKIYHYENVLLLGAFFAGLYLAGRNGVALLLSYIRRYRQKRYYKNLMKNNRFYYRPNTVSRYILFFSLISFLGCCYFGFQVFSIIGAENTKSLYPYDFMCIADDGDDAFFEDLKKDYHVTLTEYPMVRIANLDKTEHVEGRGERAIQGQQIGISETTYHQLKKAVDPSYREKDLGLDEAGEYVYIVHQQDSSTKAQPVDWFYGKAEPNLHVGVVSQYCDSHNDNSTYYEKKIAGEEIGSLTGCFSTVKCENLIVFSDEYFKEAREEWKKIDALTSYPSEIAEKWYEDKNAVVYIEGPTKLTLIQANSAYIDEIDQKMEELEEQHKYIGNYDLTVRFHYSSKTYIRDMESERAVRLLVNIYIIATLIIIDLIMLYAMCQMEKKEKTSRESFLARMGMTEKERRNMNNRELYVFFIIPEIILIITTAIFFRDVCLARMYSETLTVICAKYQIYLLTALTLVKGCYFIIVSKVVRKGIRADER